MRYFFISYEAKKINGQEIEGEFTIKSDKFPSRKKIESELNTKTNNQLISMRIFCLFEFKSEKDYNNFKM